MDHRHQLYRDRRDRAPAADALADRRWSRARADRGRSGAQPRFALSVSARQLFLLPVRISRTRRGRGAGRRTRRRPAPPVLPREERRARDLGRLSLRTRRRARDLRLRRGASDRRAGRDAAGPRGGPARAVHAAGALRGVGSQGHRHPQRSARPCAHRRERAGGDRRRPPGARRAAPRQGRARARADAPRRRDLVRGRIGARWSAPAWAGTSTRSRRSSRTNSCASAPSRSPTRRSSPADPTPACCTTATTTGSCRTASCC